MSIPAPLENRAFYGGEEIEVLIKLLAEYTNKLRAECDKYEKEVETGSNVFAKIITVVFLFISVLGFQIWLDWHHTEVVFTNASIKIVPLIFTVAEIGCIVLLVMALARAINSIHRLKRRIRSQLFLVIAQLERLVRRTSPIAEYSGISLAEKLELDLRLADADAALEYAVQYVGKQNERKQAITHKEIIGARLR